MQPTGSTPASAKIRPGCPGGLIPGNRKISRASGCNRSGFFPAGTGMSRKIVLPDAGCSKKFSRAQRDQYKIFPGRILPGKLPGTPARVPRIVPGDLPGEPLPVPPGDPPPIGIPSAHVGSPSFIKGQDGGDGKSPAIILRRRNPTTKTRKNSAVETMPTLKEISRLNRYF